MRKVTQQVVDSEYKRRNDLESRLALARRKRIENKLVEGLLSQMVESVVREEVADAYGEEMWELPLRLKVFAWWRRCAQEKQARRIRASQRCVTRDDFSRRVKALTISTLENTAADAAETNTVQSRLWPKEDVDQDMTTSLRKVSRHGRFQ